MSVHTSTRGGGTPFPSPGRGYYLPRWGGVLPSQVGGVLPSWQGVLPSQVAGYYLPRLPRLGGGRTTFSGGYYLQAEGVLPSQGVLPPGGYYLPRGVLPSQVGGGRVLPSRQGGTTSRGYYLPRGGTTFPEGYYLPRQGGVLPFWGGGVLPPGGYYLPRQGVLPSGGYYLPTGYYRQGGTPYRNSIACTCYAAGGMPLAFTQKDFLVSTTFWLLWTLAGNFCAK